MAFLKEVEVTATFGPAPGDWKNLSKGSRSTIEAFYQHPLSHNLEWSGVFTLFEKLGTVDRKSQNEIAFRIGGERHTVRTTHGKDLTTTEVMTFRHLLTRAGWAPRSSASDVGLSAPGNRAVDAAQSADLLVIIDHHEARLYHLDAQPPDLVAQIIEPYDPHHLLHHVSNNDQAREQRQRSPENHAFYENIAQAVSPAGAIVVVGHGIGRSSAAHQFMDFLHQHHATLARKIVSEVVADLSSLTAPQLLDLGRRALTAEPPPSIESPTS